MLRNVMLPKLTVNKGCGAPNYLWFIFRTLLKQLLIQDNFNEFSYLALVALYKMVPRRGLEPPRGCPH